jgi:polyisoprenoid-binding protein YceI
MNRLSSLALGAALALAAASVAPAQPALPKVAKDYKVAPAGKYALDTAHTGLIARVSHIGFSYEVIRFLAVSGSLAWDPANPATDALNVNVDAKAMSTAPTGAEDFPTILGGPKMLNVAKFPTATFVSKHFHALTATHGKVDGDLTIMGVTKPAVFDVELVGAGNEFGRQTLGVHAETDVAPNDFGLPPPFFGPPIRLVIDTEFHKTA